MERVKGSMLGRPTALLMARPFHSPPNLRHAYLEKILDTTMIRRLDRCFGLPRETRFAQTDRWAMNPYSAYGASANASLRNLLQLS